MAADTVDEVERRLGTGRTRCRTKQLAPARGRRLTKRPRPSNEPSLHEHLGGRYGTEADAVLALVDDDPALGEPLVPGLPYVRAEAVYAVRHEMARTLDDVLSRRTRARLLARDASAAAAPAVAELLAPELGWRPGRRRAPGRVLPRASSMRSGTRRTRPPRTRRTCEAPSARAARCLRSRRAGRPRRSRSAPTRPTSTARLHPGFVDVDDATLDRLRDVCAEVTVDAATLSEASRDWWPLAMIWALDGQVAGRAAAVARPSSAGAGRRRAARLQRRPGAGHGRRRSQRRVRRERAVARRRRARPVRAPRDRRRRRAVRRRRRASRNVRHTARGRAAATTTR